MSQVTINSSIQAVNDTVTICSGSSITFTDSSTNIPSGSTLNWSFDGGNPSNITGPGPHSIGYTTEGFYVAELEIGGAIDSLIVFVEEGTPNLSPSQGWGSSTFNNETYFTFCGNTSQNGIPFPFSTSSTNTNANTIHTIDWGDSSQVTVFTGTNISSDSHIYFDNGIYNVTYSILLESGCEFIETFNLFIGAPPTATISTQGTPTLCAPDGNIVFNVTSGNQNPDGTIYEFVVNDGSPSQTFTQTQLALNGFEILHYFNNISCEIDSDINGTVYTNALQASITVSNPCGQSSNASGPYTIQSSPEAFFSTSPNDSLICANSTVTYTDATFSGTNINGPSPNFECDSSYVLYWVIDGPSGQLATNSNGNVVQNPYLTVNEPIGSGGFFPNSPNFWTPGASELNINFLTPGNYSVTLYTGSNICGVTSYSESICVLPEIEANFIVSDSIGCVDLPVNITNTSSLPDCGVNNLYQWSVLGSNPENCPYFSSPGFNYLTGSTSSFEPTFEFTSPGVYDITLAINLDQQVFGCTDTTYSQTIVVKDIPSASIQSIYECQNDTLTISAENLLNCYSDSSIIYNWIFTDAISIDDTASSSPSLIFPTAGNFNYDLEISNECGTAEFSQIVIVDSIVEVGISANSGSCVNEPISIQGSITGAINTGTWTSSISGGTFTSTTDLNTTYTPPSNYIGPITITLTSDVPSGPCSSQSTSIIIEINEDAEVDAGNYSPFCIGDSIPLNAIFGGSASQISWSSMGGGTFTNINDPNSFFIPPTGFTGSIDLAIETDDPFGPCLPAFDTVTISIVPLPNIIASQDVTICTDDTITISASGGVTYVWDNGLGIGQSVNVSPSVNTIYNVNGTDVFGCQNTDQISVTIAPVPAVDSIPNIVICNGDIMNDQVFTGFPSNVSFTWSSSNTNIGLNAPTGNNLIPSFTAVNASNNIVISTITVTPSAQNCLGNPTDFTISVNPTPIITNTSLQQEICPGATTPVSWTSNIDNNLTATYQWTITNSGSTVGGFIQNGTGNLPQMNLTNNGLNPDTISYTVTPSFDGCQGLPVTYNIIVNPGPVMDQITPQEICSGENFSTTAFNSNVSGITYQWTLISNNIPTSVSGYPQPSGNGNIVGTIVENIGTAPYVLEYEVIPNIAGLCSGNPEIFNLTVQPLPQTNFDLVDQTICNLTNSNTINLVSATSAVDFIWTATVPADVNGVNLSTDSTNNVPAYTLENTTASPLTITIDAFAITQSGACQGATNSASITIIPTPIADTISSITVCNNDQNPIIPLTGVATGYNWNNNNTSTGILNSASNVLNFEAFNATNNGTAPINSTITVTPLYQLNGTICQGDNTSFSVTVNPTAQVNPISNIEVCNEDSINQIPFSTNNTIGTTTYAWTNSNTAIGLSASGNGNISTFQGTNTSSTPITATITVTPTFTHNGVQCTGATETFTITVNPRPILNPITNQTICNNQVTSAINFVSAGATDITWTNNLPSIGLASSGSGNIPPFTAINSTNAAVTATITTTSFYNTNNLSCPGNTETFTITVNPTPTVNTINNQIVCNNDTTIAVTPTGNVAATNYTWSSSNTNIGLNVPTGNNLIPSFTAVNASNNIVSSTITVTPSAQNCLGNPTDFTISVNPTPIITNTSLQQEICPGATTPVSWTSNIDNNLTATYQWTITNSGSTVGGFIQNGTGNLPQMNLTNNGLNPDTISYTVTPSFDGCQGLPVTYNIIVNPGPVMDQITPQEICSGENFSTTAFNSNVSGITYQWTLISNNIPTSVSGYPQPSGNGNIVGTIVENIGTAPYVLEYEVIPTAFGCNGSAEVFELVINPELLINFSLQNQIICNETNSQEVTLTSNVQSSNILWEVDSIPNGLIGINTLNGSNFIPPFNLENTTSQPVTLSFTVQAFNSIDSTLCPGQEYNYSITVSPAPTVNPLQDLYYCSENFSDQISFSGSANLYEWQHNLPSIGIPSSGVDSIVSYYVENNGNSPLTSTFTVTPYYNEAGLNCVGSSIQFEITINPNGQMSSISNISACNNDTVGQVQFSTNNVGGNTNYIWSNDNTSVGLSSNGLTPYIPSFIGSNFSNVSNISEIEVTPVFNAFNLNCPGDNETFNITVNPTPIFTQLNDTLICNNSSFSFIPSTNVNSIFEWQGIPNPNVTNFANNIQNSIFIEDSLINNSNNTEQVNYLISPISSPEGCIGEQASFDVTVQPNILMTSQTNYEICSGTLVNSILTSNIPSTYVWFATNNPNVSGTSISLQSSSVINDILINSSQTPQLVVYTVIPTSIEGNCEGSPLTVNVLVYPELEIISSSNETICSNEQLSIILASNSPGTFAWFADPNANISGLSTSIQNSGNINDQLLNLTNTVQTVNYNIVVTSNNQGCTSQNFVMTVDVLPEPILNPLNNITLCEGSNSNIITPSGALTSFDWTNNNTSIGLSASGNDTLSISSFTALNNNNFPISSVVNIIPNFEFNGQVCFGNSDDFEITVNPNGQVNLINDQEICNGNNYPGTIFSTQNTNGTTNYSWSNNNLFTGLNLSSGNGNIPIFTASNQTNQPISSTISVTPFFENNGITCSSLPITFDIIVNPTPTVDSLENIKLCNGELFNGQLFNSTIATDFFWTNSNASIGIPSSGFSSIPTFTAVNNSNQPVVATFEVFPIYNSSISNNFCSGVSTSFTITVEPTPIVNALNSQTVCNNELTNQVILSGNINNSTFVWTNSNTNIGLTQSTGVDTIPSFIGFNDSNSIINTTIEVTAITNGCSGPIEQFDINVYPVPTVTNNINEQIICSGQSSSQVIWQTDLVTNFPINYTWVLNSANTNITGFLNSGSGNLPIMTLNNQSNTSQTISYTVTPNSNGCIGDDYVYNLTILPTPTLDQITSQELCSGEVTSITQFTSNIGGVNYQWELSNPNNIPNSITGFQTPNGLGNIPSSVIENNGNSPYTLNYIVYPEIGGCLGSFETFEISVAPIPTIDFSEPNQIICTGSQSNQIIITTLTPNTIIEWNINNIPQGLTGVNQINGTSIIPDFNLTNTLNAPLTLDIDVSMIDSIYGCQNDTSYQITILPEPIINISSSQICSGDLLNVVLSSSVPSTYTWTAIPNPVIAGASILPQSSSIINDILVNSSGVNQIQSYVITPTALNGGCTGPSVNIDITVTPSPEANINFSGSLCDVDSIQFSSQIQQNTFVEWDFGDGSLSSEFNPIHLYDDFGNYMVNFIIYDSTSLCSNTDSIELVIQPTPNPIIEVDTNQLCLPDRFNFFNLTTDTFSQATWDFGDGNISNESLITDHAYTEPGCYDVTLTLTAENGCIGETVFEDIVCAYNYPNATFIIDNPTQYVNTNSFEFSNLSSDAHTYEWDFGDGTLSNSVNPTHTYTGLNTGFYSVNLIAYNEVGCSDEAFNTIQLIEELSVYVPNCITPNNDGTNDVFLPIIDAGIDPQSYHLFIFNRWGEIMFESMNKDIGWDGTYGGNIVKDGVYTWKINFNSPDNEEEYEYVGHVSIIK